MESWTADFNRGCRDLQKHRPVQALRRFQSALEILERRAAVDGNTSAMRSERARLHQYIARCLRKAGMRNRALGSWVKASRLQKRGPSRRKLVRLANGYGMARQDASELDDRHAFYGVQLARYLRSKKSHRLGTRAEVDMVVELISDHWEQLCERNGFNTLGHEQRLVVFRDSVIVFPFLSVPESLKSDDVAVDFYHGTRVGFGDRCICGSGLPYQICHGRTPGIEEVLAGEI